MNLRRCLPVGAWIMGLLLLVQTAWPQDQNGSKVKIPYDIVVSTTPLSSSQLARIDEYVSLYVNQISQGQPALIRTARQSLVEPFSWVGATGVFTQAYSASAGERLLRLIRSDNVMVRLNAMIITATLRDTSAVRLIELGLTDTSPAVRYWAGKAIKRMGDHPATTKEDQQALLTALMTVVQQEAPVSDPVFHQLFLGAVSLDLPEASDFLLGELNGRVQTYVQNPNRSLETVPLALRNLLVRWVKRVPTGQRVPPKLLKQMVLVAYRYMILAALHLDSDRLDLHARNDYIEMLRLSDTILNWAAGLMLPKNQARPESIKQDVEIQNWPGILIISQGWEQLLTTEPFGFDRKDLLVTTTGSN